VLVTWKGSGKAVQEVEWISRGSWAGGWTLPCDGVRLPAERAGIGAGAGLGSAWCSFSVFTELFEGVGASVTPEAAWGQGGTACERTAGLLGNQEGSLRHLAAVPKAAEHQEVAQGWGTHLPGGHMAVDVAEEKPIQLWAAGRDGEEGGGSR